jgi:hypothetical protein
MPTLIKLSNEESESVSRAIELVRAAGWHDKAEALKKALDEKKINVDLDMKLTHGAETHRRDGSVNFNQSLPLTKGTPPKPLGRNDPDFAQLAEVLLHEADHLLGHGEIEAYGEEYSFLQELNENFKKYFPEATEAEKAEIELWKADAEAHAKKMREKYIENPDWEKKP